MKSGNWIFFTLLLVLSVVMPNAASAQPTIISQPVSTSAAAGSTVGFSVAASGIGTLAYQWRKNSTNMVNGAVTGAATVSGATTAALTLTGITTNDMTLFSCRVTNTSGSVTSSVATLTVIVPPFITTQPTSRNTNVGANVTFSVAAGGTAPLSYQWYDNGSPISGATLNTYAISGLFTSDSGTYNVRVSNAAGATTSSNAVLNVGIAPAITGQPASLIVTQGQSATFTVTATGTPLNYFWKKGGTFITGATSSAYTIATVVASNAAIYTCQVSNFLGNVTSSNATLTAYSPPVITVQPVSQTVGAGSNFTVSVTATGSPAPAYQWNKDGSDLSGATTSSYTVTGAQTNDAGGYSVALTNLFGVVTSAVAKVRVLYYAPTITVQPVGQTLIVSSNFSLTVTATGTALLAYQWRKNGNNLPSANGTSYTVTGAQTNDTGAYTVAVTNVAGSKTSAVAIVNVGYAPAIVQQPQPFTNNLGTSNAFSVVVFGSEPLLYQWFKDGTAIADATNSLLPLPNLQSNQVGYYSVTVTNLYGWIGSSNALLSIPGVLPPFQWQGLVVYYPFNGNANDESGNGNNGIVNGAHLTPDRFGLAAGAYSFNGVSSSVDCGTNIYLGSAYSQFTVSTWFKTSSAGIIVSDYDAPSGGDSVFAVVIRGASQIETDTRVTGNNYDVLTTRSGLNDNQWHQVVYIMDGVSSLMVYIDAQLDHMTAFNAASNYCDNPHWRIGANLFTGVLNDYFTGSVDDVRIYNRALSSNEVAQLYALEADLPVITAQPQNQSVAKGGTASFSVTATAANPLTYQWFKDGVALTGATNTTLTLTNVQPNQIGYYAVGVSNAVTGVVSANAALNIPGYDFSQWWGLGAYYPFNGNANDESVNTNNGIVSGASLMRDRFGNAGCAYLLNGTSDYITIPDAPANDLPAQFTLAFWLDPNPGYGTPFNGSCQIIDKWGDGGIGQASYQIGVNSSGNPYFYTYDGSQTTGFVDTSVTTTGTWHQIVVTRDAVAFNLYLNKELRLSNTSLVQPQQNSVLNLTLGRETVGQYAYYGGGLDDIRIYNRALSSNEVAQLYVFEADMPVITAQPQGGIVSQGSTVSFGVAATAQKPLTYQWSQGGAPISAATNATLLIPNVQPLQAGLYTVAISNGFTGVVSGPAALLVMSSNGAGAPGFTSNQFGFGLSGPAASSFVVETSTNLKTWLPLSTNTFGAGLFQFLDPGSITNPIRFYRTRY